MDRARFEELALEQLDAVYRMALHLTRNPEQAEDLVQDVYVRALRPSAVENFENRSSDGSSMRSWLFTITHNVFYSKVKREKRAPQATAEFFAEADEAPLPDEPPPAWDGTSFAWEHVDGRLKQAIEDLKPEFREVLVLWGVEGLKYREIAMILDVPIGTVMSRLHRARKLLADALLADDTLADDLGISRLIAEEREETQEDAGSSP